MAHNGPATFGAMRGATRNVIVAVVLMLTTLLVGCADGEVRNGAGQQADQLLALATEANDAVAVEKLIAAGAEIESRHRDGRTPLLIATKSNRIEAARALIAAGADVNAVDDIGDSAYLYAGAEGLVEILELTLANGADLAATNRFGGTALIPAAEKGHPEAVRMLIAAGVAVDHINNLGWTALQEAVVLGDGGAVHLDIVGQLLAAGADPNIADREGRTPLRNAEDRNQTAIADLLRTSGGHR